MTFARSIFVGLAVMLAAPAWAQGAAVLTGTAAPAKVPYYFDREITAADLQPLTLRELDLVRNTIFALKGHTFRKQWLRDYFKAQPWYRPAEARNEVKPSARDQKNAAFVAKFAADIPAEALAQKVQALQKKPSRTPEEEIELTLAARARGVTASAPEASLSPLDDPSQLEKGVIAPDALSDLSRRDLRILRNMIYARRGRPFKSPILREYFERMEWYHADPKYTDARLTKTDKRNIKVVQDVESEVGGPLTDAEMSGDDAGAFMGAA